MYCPRCGQEQQNKQTKFCSRCGFLMSGMSDIVDKGGLPKAIIENTDPNAISPRKRGLKQGALLFMSGFIIVPILAMITIFLEAEPFAVVLGMLLTFLSGFLWMIYSMIFHSGNPTLQNQSIVATIKQDLTGKSATPKALPAQQSEPVSTIYGPPTGNWRETADLQPTSVTEETTRTLDKKTFS